MGKLRVVGTGAGSQQCQILPPPLLQGLTLRGKLGVEHLQQGALFRIGALLPVCRVAQQRIFLLQNPHIAAVTGQIPGVQLAQRSVQKFAPPLRSPLDKAQVAGVEHHRRKAACKAGRPLDCAPVHRDCPARAGRVRRTHRQTDAVRLFLFLLFLLCAEGGRFEYGEGFAPAHQLCVLAAPEALAAGKQPDSFQEVRLALAVVAADDSQLPTRRQAGRGDVPVIFDFEREQPHQPPIPISMVWPSSSTVSPGRHFLPRMVQTSPLTFTAPP